MKTSKNKRGETIARVKSLTDIKNALLKHKQVWLTMDGRTYVYAKYYHSKVWLNFGLADEVCSFDDALFHDAPTRIYDFLSFQV